MTDDLRLIEDYLPIGSISEACEEEESYKKSRFGRPFGHPHQIHKWWATRPLVACRAAVYGALVPADRFQPKNGPEEKRESLGRANAAKFVEALCKYPGDPRFIKQAQEHILEAHAERLTAELVGVDANQPGTRPAWVQEFNFTGDKVTVEDIEAGRAPRPRVLDPFAGGGSIPLEALRLGCEAYALDLNPVAHIIELCTLVYPQKYGKPDPTVRGMTGPPIADFGLRISDCDTEPVAQTGDDSSRAQLASHDRTWGGLANEVRYWGNWVLEKVKAEIGDLYPPIPVERVNGGVGERGSTDAGGQGELFGEAGTPSPTHPFPHSPAQFLTPVAYLWTRTVRCKNPSCGATVPLVKQTWLCKKKGRFVALRMIANREDAKDAKKEENLRDLGVFAVPKTASFEVVESATEDGLGFDPAAFSKAGNATCPFCGTVADSTYVKGEGCAKRMGQQMMALVCTRPGKQGKVYLSADDYPEFAPDDEAIRKRIEELCKRTGLTVPEEPIEARMTGGICLPYGLTDFGSLFTPRQTLCLLAFSHAVQDAARDSANVFEAQRGMAGAAYLGVLVNRLADYNSSLARWHNTGEKIAGTFGRQALPMVWDFAELAPFGRASGSPNGALDWIVGVAEAQACTGFPALVARGSAAALPWADGSLDAVITDPPYYDNVDYAKLADFFYVWLKRTIGNLYPEHFASDGTPKKSEAVADPVRYGGSREKAKRGYESMMAEAFAEAARVLKPNGQMTVVYAHKTTLGWATLVDALRHAGFTVTEAWPLDTEMKARLVAMDTAALASSIFLVARKRVTNSGIGSYEGGVQPQLERIVRERVATLWDMGITGADLVIAAVGAGLRAFTRFERVEYANGEEVPSEKFLAEVEGVVLETLLEKIFNVPRSGVATVDGPSRFYVLWRFAYKAAELDAGEAIVFTYGQPVELDGPNGLATGTRALVAKLKGKYRLRDFTERGDNDKLGYPDNGHPAPLVDSLHRLLYLMEKEPRNLGKFLEEVQPDRERLRLVAQALAGPGLSGSPESELLTTTAPEQAALGKLLANWRALVGEGGLFG